MLGYLILLFTLVPIVELTLLIRLGQYLGLGSTLLLVILTGIAGAYLARLQGIITLYRIQEDINSGKMPQDRLFDGIIILCSGILLLTPGIITDILGFIGLIPSMRELLKHWLKLKIKNMILDGEFKNFSIIHRAS